MSLWFDRKVVQRLRVIYLLRCLVCILDSVQVVVEFILKTINYTLKILSLLAIDILYFSLINLFWFIWVIWGQRFSVICCRLLFTVTLFTIS